MTIQLKAIEFDNAHEAIQWTDASGRGQAITVGGRYLVVEPSEADRLARAGVEFAYLHDHELPDGSHRIVTVPVNG
jgi:hypothetical protein